VGVLVDVAVAVSVGVLVGVLVGVFVGVLVEVFVGVAVAVLVGVAVEVAVFVGIGDGVRVGVEGLVATGPAPGPSPAHHRRPALSTGPHVPEQQSPGFRQISFADLQPCAAASSCPWLSPIAAKRVVAPVPTSRRMAVRRETAPLIALVRSSNLVCSMAVSPT